jgi:hypothetical protein
MERRKSQHQLHVNESTDNGSTNSSGSSDDELEENEPVMVVVEAELHAANAIDVAAAAEPVDEDTAR